MPIRYKCYKSKRPFGIELEAGNNISKAEIGRIIQSNSAHAVRVTEWEQSINNNFWHVKQDSTCGPNAHNNGGKDYGWEIASYKGAGHEDVGHIADVAEKLQSAGLLVNNNCGLHIHAQIADFNATQAGVLLALWFKIEPIMAYLVPERRINNIHCKMWSKARKIAVSERYTGETLWNTLKPNNYAAHGNNQKKVTLNFVNYAYAIEMERHGHNTQYLRKTVELRMPEGTLSGKDIRNWIMLFTHFVDHAKKSKMPENLSPAENMSEFLQILNLENKDDFYILSAGLGKLKAWIMERIINSDWAGKDRKGQKVMESAKERLQKMSVLAA